MQGQKKRKKTKREKTKRCRQYNVRKTKKCRQYRTEWQTDWEKEKQIIMDVQRRTDPERKINHEQNKIL